MMPSAKRGVQDAGEPQDYEHTDIIRLAADDQLRFVEMLLNPDPLSPAMERARDAHARLPIRD
jgi:hypothetical protein